jgi:hypothetical protein
MNYAVVAIGGVLVLVVIAWFAWGRASFRGAAGTLEGEEGEREGVDDEKVPVSP